MKLRIPNPYALFGFGGLLLIAACFYNAGLAFLNAHIIMVGTLHVALTEAVILAIAVVYIASKIRVFPNIMPPVIFMVFMGMMFLFVSFLNEHFYPKALRDMILIAVFFMVGGTVTEQNLFRTFRFMAIAIFIVMIVEAYFTNIYSLIFQPADYYANTRGIQKLDNDETGLFRNSLGYSGRFSFGIFDTHRLSSLFLEQVSLANFAMIITIFASSFWSSIGRWDRCLYIGTVIFILLTNNSRTATILCSAFFVGHFIFPYLPRYIHMFYMPFILIGAAIFFYDPEMGLRLERDDLSGRVGHTIANLVNMDMSYFTGGTLPEIYRMFDSGFVYLILTQTVFGLIAFWLFTSLVVQSRNAGNKRFNNAMAIYIFMNLLTSGAIFSIKVSAPLFLIAGYLSFKTSYEASAIKQRPENGNAA